MFSLQNMGIENNPNISRDALPLDEFKRRFTDAVRSEISACLSRGELTEKDAEEMMVEVENYNENGFTNPEKAAEYYVRGFVDRK